jgi:hypothetical protein
VVAAPAASSGRGLAPALLILAALLIVAGAAGWLVLRRKRAEPMPVFEPTRPPAPMPPPMSVTVGPVTPAVVRVCDGPLSGTEMPVQGEPVTIGSGRGCSIVLPANGGHVEELHARIWHRDGRFMLHRVARRGAVTMAGRPVEWVVLESGDRFSIDSHEFVFQLRASSAVVHSATV